MRHLLVIALDGGLSKQVDRILDLLETDVSKLKEALAANERATEDLKKAVVENGPKGQA